MTHRSNFINKKNLQYKMSKENFEKEEEKIKKKEKKQQRMLQKIEDEQLMADLEIDKAKLKTLKKKLAKVEGYPERGIETWYRLASRNLYTRRQIVDTKSNILITVNAIMISAIMSSFYPRLNDDPHLIYGIIPIVLGNLISMIYAVIATRPKIGTGEFSDNEVHQKKASLMTFDDYYKMPLETYKTAVDEMMENGDFLYDTIKIDLHRLGVDLSERYNGIRTAYNVFLLGLIIGLFAFGMCHAIL